MLASSLYGFLLLFLGQLVFGLAVEPKASLEIRAGSEDGYPGLDQLKAASQKFGVALDQIKSFSGQLGLAQVFFQQSLEAIRLLDDATREITEQPPINAFTAISYTPVATKFFGQATDLSRALKDKKDILVKTGWGDNTYQLLDSLYRSGSALLKIYFEKKGGLLAWMAGPWENSLNSVIADAREAFRNNAAMMTTTVIVYQPAPTAGPQAAPYGPPQAAPYAPPPQFQAQPQQQQYQPQYQPYDGQTGWGANDQ